MKFSIFNFRFSIVLVAIALVVSSVRAGDEVMPTPTPVPTPPSWYRQITETITEGSEQKSLQLVVAPTYAPKLANRWGASIALLHPFGDHAFVGVRGDVLDGGYFAGSASVGLKTEVNLFGINFSPFALTGVVTPLTNNAGDKQFEPGAIVGTGVGFTVWQNAAKTMKLSGFGEAEYWSQYPGIQIYHVGGQASISW